jgi:hypothetical protein
MSDENPDVKEARRLADIRERLGRPTARDDATHDGDCSFHGDITWLLALLDERQKKLDRWTSMRRSGTPSFDGEGKYDDQWSAWDDGYVQGLDVFLTRAEAAESSLASLRAENERLIEELRKIVARGVEFGKAPENLIAERALAGPVIKEKK